METDLFQIKSTKKFLQKRKSNTNKHAARDEMHEIEEKTFSKFFVHFF